jgi:hypothetical protein
MKYSALFCLLMIFSCQKIYSQGAFQNLDFEGANPISYGPPYPNSYVTVASALPGWQGFVGGSATPVVWLDGLSTGGAGISIVNNDSQAGTQALQGNWSAVLFAGGEPANQGVIVSTALTQTGVIPAGTQSIQMDAAEQLGTFSVALNGSTIQMTPLEIVPGYTIYGSDISAWAGQTATLSITENPSSTLLFGVLEVDNISFSQTAVVPEPGPLLLTGVGGTVLAIYRRLAPKSRYSNLPRQS